MARSPVAMAVSWFSKGAVQALSKSLNKSLAKAFQKIKNEFSGIKEELDDHREAINQHDQELKEVYLLVEKMMERQEEQDMLTGARQQLHVDIALTTMERRLLLILYTSDYLLSLSDLADRLGAAQPVVEQLLEELTAKGVSLLRQTSLDQRVYIQLDPKFRAMQAKKNLFRLHNLPFSEQ